MEYNCKPGDSVWIVLGSAELIECQVIQDWGEMILVGFLESQTLYCSKVVAKKNIIPAQISFDHMSAFPAPVVAETEAVYSGTTLLH